MKIHDYKLSNNLCNRILDLCKNEEHCQINIRETGARQGPSTSFDEQLILKHYKNHQESGYINYISPAIDNCVPDSIFQNFKLSKSHCKIDVKQLLPGKVHIPHRDYYLNFKLGIKSQGSYEFDYNNQMVNTNDIIRLWITLTEPKFGHILLVEQTAVYFLPQGSIVTWDYGELHTAANLGYESRFIMTITGQVQC
jgi:hypothetical protein